MLECLRGFVAAQAGGRDITVPGWMRAEVAFARSHLVQSACSEFVEAHKRVRHKPGAVEVSGRVWRSIFPFLEEEAGALQLELGVRAAWGGSG